MKHYLTVSQGGALVGLRHEACPAGETMQCPYSVAWSEIRYGPRTMPQPALFENYPDGEHEMQLTIFGDLQGKDADIPWREPAVTEPDRTVDALALEIRTAAAQGCAEALPPLLDELARLDPARAQKLRAITEYVLKIRQAVLPQ